MLGFREFLDETWKQGEAHDDFHHTSHVAGHHVQVSFDNAGKDAHSIGYKINHSWDRNDSDSPSSEDAKKIFKHIHHKIHQFMRHRKPKKIRLTAWDGDEHGKKRAQLNHVLAHSLAKKYGGKVREDNFFMKSHTVEKD